MEAPHAKYPESKIQNQADQGAEYAGKTDRIKQAGMATDVDTAANMQLGTGQRVNDPTSGEVRNRIMRGEPEDIVKQQDLLRKKGFINPKHQQIIDIAKQYKLTKLAKKGARLAGVAGTAFVITNLNGKVMQQLRNHLLKTWTSRTSNSRRCT